MLLTIFLSMGLIFDLGVVYKQTILGIKTVMVLRSLNIPYFLYFAPRGGGGCLSNFRLNFSSFKKRLISKMI